MGVGGMSCCIDLLGFVVSTGIGPVLVREPDTLIPNFPWNQQPWGLEVVSTSAADTVLGNNARSVYVEYLDDSGIQRNITVPLNGITPVPVAVAAWRIQRAWVASAGPGQTNAGTISFRETNGGTVQGVISLTENRMNQGMWCCPSNARARVSEIIVSSVPPVTPFVFSMYTRPVTGNAYIFRGLVATSAETPTANIPPINLEPLEDIFFAVRNVSGVAYQASVSCNICITGLGYAVVPGGFGPPK